MRVLVVQTAFLGDAILSVPLLNLIHAEFPDAEIYWFGREGVASLMGRIPWLAGTVDVKKTEGHSERHWLQALSKLRALNADLVFCPHQSFRSAWMVKALGCESYGFKFWWNKFFFSKRIKRPMRHHDAIRQASLMSLIAPRSQSFFEKLKEPILSMHDLGQEHSTKELVSILTAFTPLDLSDVEIPAVDSASLDVLVAPGSQWASKRWEPAGFAQVIDTLTAQGRHVTLIGASSERELSDKVYQMTRSKKAESSSVKNLCGQTSLAQLAKIMRHSKLLISNDSGSQHLASLMGIPVVSVFGPTIPAQGYGPWNRQSRIVEVELDCRPCGAHGHQICPLGHHHCMKLLSSDMVLQAVRDLSEHT